MLSHLAYVLPTRNWGKLKQNLRFNLSVSQIPKLI